MRLRWAILACAVLGGGLPLPAETLVYKAEWRLMRAGTARIVYNMGAGNPGSSHAQLTLATEGFVGTLYKVDNEYETVFDGRFCTSSTRFRAHEGRKHRLTRVTFNATPGKANLVETDLLNNQEVVATREIDVPPCVHDVVAGLARLRTVNFDPGKRLSLPVSDGKKSVTARVDVQQKATIEVPAGKFETVRVEAFLFNDVLYRRKGRLFVWLTNDERKLPVQIKIDLPFYIGNVTLKLETMDKP